VSRQDLLGSIRFFSGLWADLGSSQSNLGRIGQQPIKFGQNGQQPIKFGQTRPAANHMILIKEIGQTKG
jgi:hypothetical protein